MKLIKKTLIIILLIALFIELQLFINPVKAFSAKSYLARIGDALTSSFETKLVSSKETVNPDEVFTVTVQINNLKNTTKGIVAISGQLEFDTDVLELYETEGTSALSGENGWNLAASDTDEAFNRENFKFIADNNEYINGDSPVFTIKFKVKNTVTENVDTQIALKNVEASGGTGVISAVRDSSKTISVKLIESITSEEYDIGEDIITRIPANTTVRTFKQNVTTEQNIVVKDKAGNVLSDDKLITTNSTIEVGETLRYTVSVNGDIDEDGKISINDLALIKLHYIDSKKISGIKLTSADVDGDGNITINDIAQIKIVLIK